MSEGHPRLQAVGEDGEDTGFRDASASVSADDDESSPRTASTIIAVLCLALIVCAFLMFTQARQTGQLQDEILRMSEQLAAAEGAVASAQAEVALHEARLAQVRGSVGDLSARLAALRELVGSDLRAPAEAPVAE